MKSIIDRFSEKKLSNKREAQAPQMTIEMLEEAQEHLHEALEILTKVATMTNDVHAEMYIVRALSELIEAENPHNFSVANWIEQLEEGDMEEESNDDPEEIEKIIKDRSSIK